MTDRLSETRSICRCELLQLAFDGVVWPDLSVERLLDRVAEPDELAPLHQRDFGPKNRTVRCFAQY
ncbi:MAG: hypothetical protein GVY31_09490 [Alphaproteobacteria bacterium]|jgi:hypothetical protein|nr:hypothetical protein [Alphaproteobacteria bacterium]